MRNAILGFITVLVSISVCSQNTSKYFDHNHNGKQDIYEDKSQPIAQRVEDLLSQMTRQEKEGQLLMTLGWNIYDKKDTNFFLTQDFYKEIKEKHTGGLWCFYRADPWCQKTLDNAITPQESKKENFLS